MAEVCARLVLTNLVILISDEEEYIYTRTMAPSMVKTNREPISKN